MPHYLHTMCIIVYITNVVETHYYVSIFTRRFYFNLIVAYIDTTRKSPGRFNHEGLLQLLKRSEYKILV